MVSSIKDRLQILCKKMKEPIYNSYVRKRVKRLVNELEKRDIKGLDKFVQRLIDNAGDKEAYLDILMEGRFAKILSRNSFSDIQIEFADKGPDIKATWKEETVYFEITRKRPTNEDKGIQDNAKFISPSTANKVISKILEKIPQLQTAQLNVVVIWSDTITLGTHELEEAFEYIRQEINDDQKKYKDLSGVLLTEGGGVNIGTFKQFYLFKNEKTSKRLETDIAKKLESLHEQDVNRLQREWDAIYAVIRRMS